MTTKPHTLQNCAILYKLWTYKIKKENLRLWLTVKLRLLLKNNAIWLWLIYGYLIFFNLKWLLTITINLLNKVVIQN